MFKLDETQLIATLDKIPFFREFSQEEKISMASLSTHLMNFKDGISIIRQGRIESALYVLLKGKVKVTRDEQPRVDLAKLKPGAIFGEIAFISKRPRSTNVISMGDSMVLKIDSTLFDKVIKPVQNKIKDRIIQILIHRIDQMNKNLINAARS